MELNNEKSITTGAYVFAYLLSGFLLKYVLYDNGFTIANILLVAGVAYVRLFMLKEESSRLQEGASLILFVLFDKNLLDFGNVLLLLGVACIREQFRHTPLVDKDVLYKETISFTCGLIFALMGWYSVGRILIIYALIMFYYFTILMALSVFVIFTLFENFLEYLKNYNKKEPQETDMN